MGRQFAPATRHPLLYFGHVIAIMPIGVARAMPDAQDDDPLTTALCIAQLRRYEVNNAKLTKV